MGYERTKFLVGLDLGQARDHTAVAVLKRNQSSYDVPFLQRFPLGTSYAAVVDRVMNLMFAPPLGGDAVLVADATGVGMPVIDLLKPDLRRHLYAATITSGEHAAYDGNIIRVPKRDLVTTMALLLEGGRLKVASELPNAKTLVDELLAFRVRISARGHDSYGTPDWRDSEHDDLVLAVALAAWVGEHPPRIARLVR